MASESSKGGLLQAAGDRTSPASSPGSERKPLGEQQNLRRMQGVKVRPGDNAELQRRIQAAAEAAQACEERERGGDNLGDVGASARLVEENERLKGNNERLEEQMEALKEELTDTKADNSSLTHLADQHAQRVRDLEMQLATAHAASPSKSAGDQSELVSLKARLELAESKMAAAEASAKTAQKEAEDRVKAARVDADSQVKQLELRVKELSEKEHTASDAHQASVRETQSLRMELESMKNLVTAQKATIANLEKSAHSSPAPGPDASAKAEIESLTASRNSLKVELLAIKDEVTRLRGENTVSKSAKEKAQRDLETARQEAAATKSELANTLKKLEEVSKQGQGSGTPAAAAAAAVHTSDNAAESEALKAQVAKANKELQEMKEKAELEQKHKEELISKLKTALVELATLKSQRGAAAIPPAGAPGPAVSGMKSPDPVFAAEDLRAGMRSPGPKPPIAQKPASRLPSAPAIDSSDNDHSSEQGGLTRSSRVVTKPGAIHAVVSPSAAAVAPTSTPTPTTAAATTATATPAAASPVVSTPAVAVSPPSSSTNTNTNTNTTQNPSVTSASSSAAPSASTSRATLTPSPAPSKPSLSPIPARAAVRAPSPRASAPAICVTDISPAGPPSASSPSAGDPDSSSFTPLRVTLRSEADGASAGAGAGASGVDEEQAKPSIQNRISRFVGPPAGPAVEKCEVCSQTVYAMEKLAADDKVFHKKCFTCLECKKPLSVGAFAAMGGRVYCKPHFKQLFKLKGNYDEGFGQEQHKNKWNRHDEHDGEDPEPDSTA